MAKSHSSKCVSIAIIYGFNLALKKIDLGAPNRREITNFQGFSFQCIIWKFSRVSFLIGNKKFSEIANVKGWE